MQEVIVFILFFAIIAYSIYKFVRKPSGDGCSKCEFNHEKD